MSMTDSAENIALANHALDLLGAKRLTLAATTEQNYVYCAVVFDQSRDEVLSSHKWNYAKKRAYAIQTTDPLFGYDNAFTYPTDCLKVWQIEQDPLAKFEVEGGLILTDEGTAPSAWADETAYIIGEYISNDDVSYICIKAHTSGDADDEPGTGAATATYWTSAGGDYTILETEYVYRATAVDSYPAYLYQCCVYNLAIKLAPAIKQNEEAALNLQAMLYGSKKVTGYMDIARSIDAQEQGGVVIKTNTFLNARR